MGLEYIFEEKHVFFENCFQGHFVTECELCGLFWILLKIMHLLISVAEPEPPILGWSRSQFFYWSEPAASFWQAKKESLVVVTKHDLKAIYNNKCDPKKQCCGAATFLGFSGSRWPRSRSRLRLRPMYLGRLWFHTLKFFILTFQKVNY